MSNKLVTSDLHIQTAAALKADIDQSSYYVFTAKYTPYANISDSVIPVPEYSAATASALYNNMIFGRRIKSTDVSLMAKRYDWTNGTIYSQYDQTDAHLADKKFYVVVSNGITYSVYKCLSNNNGAASTVEPYGSEEEPFETPEDGYVWKFLYTASEYDVRRFATNDYFPVIVSNTATTVGTIDIINVNESGQGYDNYNVGSFTQNSDIYIGGDTSLLALDSNAVAVNGFYKNCVIKITSGLALNEYREVVDFYVADGQRIIRLADPFIGQIKPTDTYELYPMVYVYDTGNSSTANCVARALISANTANSVASVEVLNAGRNYRSAIATLNPSNTVGVNVAASLSPIVSPPGGHGSDIPRELFANYVGLSTTFISNTEVYTTSNDFRTIGLIRNPTFANAEVSIVAEDTVGSFAVGERLYHYLPYQLDAKVSLNANSVVTSDNFVFDRSLRSGDQILVSDGSQNQIAFVNIVTSTNIHIDREPSFTSANCTLSILRSSDFGQVTKVGPSSLTVTDILPSDFQYSFNVVGGSSSTTTSLNTSGVYPAYVNGRSLDSFNSFLQLTKLIGTMDTEQTFIDDEPISQAEDTIYTPKAVFHSMEDNGDGTFTMFLINVNKDFTTTASGGTGIVVGETSGAQFTAQYKYDGELVADSGQIVYIENINAVSRSPSQSETIKLILEC